MTHLGNIAVPRTVQHGPGGPTLPAQLVAQATVRGDAVALLHKQHGLWRRWTWRQLAAETAELAAAIADHGIAPGEAVAIAGASRPRLLVAMLACQWLGAVPVLVPQAGAGVTLEQALTDHVVRLVFVAGEHEVHAINALCDRLPVAPTVVCDDLRGLRSRWAPWLQAWDVFAGNAPTPLPAPQAVPSNTAALVYAADAGGKSAATALTHATLAAQAELSARAHAAGPDDRVLVALPLGWSEVLSLGPALALHAGFALAFAENDTTVLRDLRELAPTLLFGPPAFYRQLRQQAFLAAAGAGWPWRGLLARGLGLSEDAVGPTGGLARALVAGPTADRLGISRVRSAVSFGGMVPPQVMAFFAALDIRVQPFDAGASVSAIELAEAALRGSVFIRDAAVARSAAGELAALIAIDNDAVASWAAANGHSVRSSEGLAALHDVHVLIARQIAAAGAEPVAAFLIAPRGFSIAAGELTERGELRRDAIEQLHAPALAMLRAGRGIRLPLVEPSQPRPRENLELQTAAFDGVWI